MDNRKMINVTVYNLCNKVIKDLFVENASVFVSYKTKLNNDINDIKTNYNRGSIDYYHDNSEILEINPYLMEMSGDAFNHWIVSINDLVMNLIEEILAYTNVTDINPSIFKKNIDNYVNNKLQDDYIIKRQFVEQGMKNLKLDKRTYTKTDWITSLEYGLQLNDTILSNLSKLTDIINFLKGYSRQLLSYTEKVYDETTDYDEYMDSLMSEADFYKFQLDIFVKLQRKMAFMMQYAKVRLNNYLLVLSIVNATLNKEYPNLEKNEEIGVLVQLIFQNNIELEKFELKLAFSNTK